jgi:hypothetical protein
MPGTYLGGKTPLALFSSSIYLLHCFVYYSTIESRDDSCCMCLCNLMFVGGHMTFGGAPY